MLRPHAAHKGSFFMPALGAPTAKRDVNYGTEFASKDTVLDAVMSCEASGSFFAVAGSDLFNASDKPDRGGEYQYLVLMDDTSGPRRTVIAYTYSAGNVYLRSVRDEKWQSDGWLHLANQIPPDIHELPLADGWQTYGTSINWYSKDQFGQVTVCFRLKSTSETDCNAAVIAVLPEGFKPQNSITTPGLITFANYTRMPCHVDINANGVVQLYADGSVPSNQKVIELTCAEFHYPAG